jgi:hypothetical protein
VTWASIFAFGETEKEDHSQVHHRQLMAMAVLSSFKNIDSHYTYTLPPTEEEEEDEYDETDDDANNFHMVNVTEEED